MGIQVNDRGMNVMTDQFRNTIEHTSRIVLLCAQGGEDDARLIAGISEALANLPNKRVEPSIVSLLTGDANTVREKAHSVEVLPSFEAHCSRGPVADLDAEVDRIVREYPDTNWWSVAAGERNIVDSSFLVGGLGNRLETKQYVEELIVNLVTYFESVFKSANWDTAVCPESDSLISHVFYQVARHFGIRVTVLTPNAWIREDGKPGFFIGRNPFLMSDSMEENYKSLQSRTLTEEEQSRVNRFKGAVAGFDVQKTFLETTKKPFVVPAVSPNWKRSIKYLKANAQRNKHVEYYKIDPISKLAANLRRAWRRRWVERHMGSKTPDFPKRSVFYAMQYQPEQSTLVGGIFYANQIATIENIAKCLPLGYTLIVKEHPRGRGARPIWQYKHLASIPNIEFCDADSKEILKRCDAVVTITSTIGLEAIALDKPAVVLGDCYFEFPEFVYKSNSWVELAEVFKKILVHSHYENLPNRHLQIDRFFLAYLLARIPVQLCESSGPEIAEAIYSSINKNKKDQ